ncbi:uncharacterized protein UV8b_05027 [Ustilaginoidea virens]|uniref:Uncharacterized protein n=1 Tax=Ustilaginoidea virens TaxID=1159556 RepID=A0A8E5HSL0_USTVR|nr:uncharacterized protein UV8b_05027 [Ustilaginoidea virens]QUC20786.1 hypothetical protein UV8b_05027 [Ustilaginoidea virens]
MSCSNQPLTDLLFGPPVLKNPPSAYPSKAPIITSQLRPTTQHHLITLLSPISFHTHKYDWTWQGRQGFRQGRCQASPQNLTRQYPGHHQTCNSSSCSSWRGQAYLCHDLRRNPHCT